MRKRSSEITQAGVVWSDLLLEHILKQGLDLMHQFDSIYIQTGGNSEIYIFLIEELFLENLRRILRNFSQREVFDSAVVCLQWRRHKLRDGGVVEGGVAAARDITICD